MKNSTAQILSQLDLQQVSDAVHSVVLPEFYYEDLSKRILHAADIFLEKDLRETDEILVEFSFDNITRGIFDLVLVKNGKAKIVDWKTTSDVKKPNFADELKGEFQTSFYLVFGGEALSNLGYPVPEILEYRAIDEKEMLRTSQGEQYVAAPANVLVVSQLNSPQMRQDALAQLDAIEALYEAQMHLPVWARNKPRACFKGWTKGPACPFWEDCSNMTMPGLTEEQREVLWDKRPLSKSAIKDFLNCNEQYRRLRVMQERLNVQKSLPILLGEAFHEGIASIYEQTNALKKAGTLHLG